MGTSRCSFHSASLSPRPPPPPAPLLPAPPSRAEAFCPESRAPPRLPHAQGCGLQPGGCGGRAGAVGPALWGRGGRARPTWAGAAEPAGGCGAGPALRSRPLPPYPAPPRPAPPPRRQPAPLRSSGGSGATGMRRGAGPRWLLLAALLGTLCCAAAGGGRRRAASLGEMLREVEALMEDTQYKLRNAVQEVRGRRGALPSSLPSLPGPGQRHLRAAQRRQPLTRLRRFLSAAAPPPPPSGAGPTRAGGSEPAAGPARAPP